MTLDLLSKAFRILLASTEDGGRHPDWSSKPRAGARARRRIAGAVVHRGSSQRLRLPEEMGLPVHVTLRAREGLPSLRADKLLLGAVRSAIAGGQKADFRIVHFSIQSNHLHLIVEADDTESLSRGMQGFCARVVHAVHRSLGHKGAVFADRYHALKTPRETRAARERF